MSAGDCYCEWCAEKCEWLDNGSWKCNEKEPNGGPAMVGEINCNNNWDCGPGFGTDCEPLGRKGPPGQI